MRDHENLKNVQISVGSMVLSDNVDNKSVIPDSSTEGESEARHCLDCGYDLRGHDGDPIRCPECGGENTRADLSIAAKLTTKDFEEFETGPTSAIACFIAILVGLYIIYAGGLACGLVLFLPAAPGWLFAAIDFGKRHGYKNGWVDILAWFHLTILAIVSGIVGFIVVGDNIRGGTGLGDSIIEIAMMLVLLVLLPKLPEKLNPYSIAKCKLAAFARRCAVEKKKAVD